MNKVERPRPLAGYDEDFARWSSEQAALLRSGKLDGLDWENVAEEINSLGKSDNRELRRRMNILLAHLLKGCFQPANRKGGWKATIREQRRALALLLADSPSLKRLLSSAVESEYAPARLDALDETSLPASVMPSACPFTVEQVLDPAFYPQADESGR